MSMEANLIAKIKAIAGMSALVGTRVYMTDLPEDPQWPCICLQEIGGEVEMAHDGDTDAWTAEYQADCYAATDAAALQIRELIDGALIGFKGSMGDTTVDGIFPGAPYSAKADLPGATIFQRTRTYEIQFQH